MEGLKEYILREDAVAAVMETDPHVFLTYNKKKEKTDIVVAQITEEVLEEINKIPAADVVEVCRCGECENWKADFPYNTCALFGGRWNENMFCSYGRRKNG